MRRGRYYGRSIARGPARRRRISMLPLTLVLLLIVAAGIGVIGYRYWLDRQAGLSPTPPATPGTPSSSETEPPPSNDPWEAARRRGATFRGIGQEPGWAVEIVRGESIHFLFDYGQSSLTATMATGESGARPGATVYEADSPSFQLSVTVEDRPCTDSMSGQEFPNTVTVTFNGNVFNGCGRPLD